MCLFCFQAEDGIRDLVRSRGLGDVYKRQGANVGRRLERRVERVEKCAAVLGVVLPAVLTVQDLSLIHI